MRLHVLSAMPSRNPNGRSGRRNNSIATFTSAADVGTATVTVNETGQYFVTIEEPIVLTRNSATSQFDTEPTQLEVTTLNVFGELPTTQTLQ